MKNFLLLPLGFVAALVILIAPQVLYSQANFNFSPPSTVTLLVYPLKSNGEIDAEKLLCKKGDLDYGCSVGDGTRGYPFDKNPITLDIETEYLPNVLPKETPPNPPFYIEPTALQAQAIVARTYIYERIHNAAAYRTINNSTEFQVYVPNSFGAPGFGYAESTCTNGGSLTDMQTHICTALTDKSYLAYFSSQSPAYQADPIDALYAADIQTRTMSIDATAGPPRTNYLVGVEDPISANHSDSITLGNPEGFSQRGASRWAYGSQSFCNNKIGPGKLDKCLTNTSAGAPYPRWSVKWYRPEQILTHYYTGVNLRNAEDVSDIVAPTQRWVPLQIKIDGTPHVAGRLLEFEPATTYQIEIQLQNTSVDRLGWGCNLDLGIRYELVWHFRYKNTLYERDGVEVCDLGRGMSRTLTLDVKTPSIIKYQYALEFDIHKFEDGKKIEFSDPDSNGLEWPVYSIGVRVGSLDCSNTPCVFIPTVVSGPPVVRLVDEETTVNESTIYLPSITVD